MHPGSSHESESDYASQDGGFIRPQSKKRGRKPKSSTPTTSVTPEAKRKAPSDPTTNPTSNAKTFPPRFPTFSHVFVVSTKPTVTRVQLAIRWEQLNASRDVIIRQESKFIIKTNDELKAIETLQQMKNENLITTFAQQKTDNKTTMQHSNTNRYVNPTYSVVATGVDLDITDEMFLNHLQKMELQVRFCKRIISRARNSPTLMMRLITGDLTTYEKLINDRTVHFLGRVFRIVESKPPAPIPAPCSKCNSFDHKSEDCKTPTKCNKCLGPHTTSTCSSPLPIKCVTCNSNDHAAWSMKCPKRPTAPIEGIPNVKIKCLNKRTAEVSDNVAKQSRIHNPITTHDFIINTYKHEINKTSNVNREELLKKLRKRFTEDYDIDTSVVFFGSHMYILMFDLLLPNRNSPTEPHDQLKQTVTNIEHSL